MTGLGPFEVPAEQVEGLGAAFTWFVNQLLSLECVRAGLRSHQLRIDSQDETGDGGVDAQLFSDVETGWIPEGVSAWQFKSGDRKPGRCKKELRGASFARELLEAGAKYYLVLGKRLTPEKIARRRAALIEEAAALDLGTEPEQFEVLDANKLAAWASQFPALAVSEVLNGPGYAAMDFDRWSKSIAHQTDWTSSETRKAGISQIQADIGSSDRPDIHVQCPSGIGKTRLVLEALRGTPWEPLVAYVSHVDDLTSALVNHAMSPSRAVVLVVDECDSRRHENLAERIPTDALVRLVTIGQDASYTLRSPVLAIGSLVDEALDEFLRRNYSPLGSEARRFVVAHAGGNVGWAMILADRIKGADAALAAELVRQEDIEHFTSQLIPDGRSFFLAAVLALFERVGWGPPTAPEVLDYYAERSPVFMAARFDAARAEQLGQGVGDSTPIMATIPTDDPWVPVRILALGLDGSQTVEADVFMLTEAEPALLIGGRGMTVERSEQASDVLLSDLRSDVGMEWVPNDMWLSYLKVDAPAAELDYDLAASTTPDERPAPADAGVEATDTLPLRPAAGVPVWPFATAGLVLLAVLSRRVAGAANDPVRQ